MTSTASVPGSVPGAMSSVVAVGATMTAADVDNGSFDPDGDPLTFTTTILNAAGQAFTPAALGLSFDPATRLLAGRPGRIATTRAPETGSPE